MVWAVPGKAHEEIYHGLHDEVHREPLQLTIPLLGLHQVENAAMAYATLQVANAHGIPVNDAAIQKGFREAVWPARFELLQRNPMVIIDSAHTLDSASKLGLALDDYFPGEQVILIFGASEDKDIRGMLAELAPRVNQVIATQSIHPRAMDPELIASVANELGLPVIVSKTVAEALESALQLSKGKRVVLATGSIFSAAGVRQAWFEKNNIPITF